jgi:hypothetical protein
MRLAALLALTIVAGVLRFTALDFGLPDKFRPDEEYLTSRAVGFRNDFNPNFSIYPAGQMYVQHGVLRLVALIEGHQGDFREIFLPEGLSRAHLVGRQLSAAFGTATIPAMYWAVLPAYGAPAALASAGVMALATLHVRDSKFATSDAACVFWLTLAMGMLLRIVTRGRRMDSLLAGIFVGAAIGTKYPAGALLGGLALAHIGARFREGRSLWRVVRDIRPYLTLWAALVTTLCFTPYLLLDWEETVTGFAYQRGFVERGVGNEFAGWGWTWLLTRAFPDSLGDVLSLLLAAAVLWATLRPRPGTWSLLAFVAIACAGIAASRYTFYRYILIPLPALAILAGLLWSDVREFLEDRTGRGVANTMATLGLICLLIPAGIRDYKINRLLGRRDSRTVAGEWIATNIPRGALIAMTDRGTPYGKPTIGNRRAAPFVDVADARRKGIRWVLSDSSILPFYSRGPSEFQLADLEESASLVLDIDPRKPDTPTPVYDQADAFYVPLRHASSIKRPGPRIRIWEIDSDSP